MKTSQNVLDFRLAPKSCTCIWLLYSWIVLDELWLNYSYSIHGGNCLLDVDQPCDNSVYCCV